MPDPNPKRDLPHDYYNPIRDAILERIERGEETIISVGGAHSVLTKDERALFALIFRALRSGGDAFVSCLTHEGDDRGRLVTTVELVVQTPGIVGLPAQAPMQVDLGGPGEPIPDWPNRPNRPEGECLPAIPQTAREALDAMHRRDAEAYFRGDEPCRYPAPPVKPDPGFPARQLDELRGPVWERIGREELAKPNPLRDVLDRHIVAACEKVGLMDEVRERAELILVTPEDGARSLEPAQAEALADVVGGKTAEGLRAAARRLRELRGPRAPDCRHENTSTACGPGGAIQECLDCGASRNSIDLGGIGSDWGGWSPAHANGGP